MLEKDSVLLELTAEVVSAYAGNNAITAAQLPEIIRSVHNTFSNLDKGEAENEPQLIPAVPVRRSVKPDAIVCLECGTVHKMLKRHLKTAHQMSVEDYREKWGLKSDYPMVAPNYAKQRSQLAKQFGLGRKAK